MTGILNIFFFCLILFISISLSDEQKIKNKKSDTGPGCCVGIFLAYLHFFEIHILFLTIFKFLQNPAIGYIAPLTKALSLAVPSYDPRLYRLYSRLTRR